MQSILKFKSHGFMLFLSIITFAAFNCEHKKIVEVNRSEKITWQQTALDSLRIFFLATHPNLGVIAASCGQAIYRSLNQGTTWTPIHPGACPRSLAINSDGEIFSVGGVGFLRSINSGASWFVSSLGLNVSVNLKSIVFTASKEIFVSSTTSDESKGGIYRSSDNGNVWMRTTFPDSIGPRVLAINFKGDIFAGTGYGVFRSIDNGQTWMQINTGFRNLGFNPFISTIAIDPIRGDIFAAIEGDGIYRSTDNGDTWTHTGLTNPTIGSLVINSKGHIFAGSSSNSPIQAAGVFYSNDMGKTWIQTNNGLKNIDVLSLVIDSSNYVYAGTRGSGIFRTVNSTTQ